jgi:hypothetical protein
MLSPNDILPKGKAASIRSFDSGYASNTLEDDEHLPVSSDSSIEAKQPTTERPPTRVAQPQIGLGITGLDFSGFGTGCVERLRWTRPEVPIGPVTTKLHVFTTRETSDNPLPLPSLAYRTTTCITCQLWDLTNPGEGLKCDGCKSENYIRPGVLGLFDANPRPPKLVIPRLDTLRVARPKSSSKRRNKTRCSACELAYAIDSTQSPACSSCSSDPFSFSPNSQVQPSTVRRSCAKRFSKLPVHASNHLRAWLRDHRDNPYPDHDSKRILAQECCITEKQVATWFTNIRARKMAPLAEVSRHSSEDERADESDFSSVANTPICRISPTSNYTPVSNSLFPPNSGPTTYDHTSLTLQTSRRGKKKDYRRANTVSPSENSPVPRTPVSPSPRPDGHEQPKWPCTFCDVHLAPKSWRRHEETQHRVKSQWTCLATSPRIVVSSRTESHTICAFCQTKNPSDDHFLHSHRITECSKKSEADRTFGRPDHLRQHVKNFHKTSLLDMVREKWRRDGPDVTINESWTCGFCAAELKTWNIRETHISNHFKEGLTMNDWLGQPEATAPNMANNKRRASRGEPDIMPQNLKRTLPRCPSQRPEPQHLSHNFVSATNDSFMPSSACSNMIGATAFTGFTGIDFDDYTSDIFMNEFDFPGPSDVGNLAAMYPTHDDPYGVYMGNEAMQMEYEAPLVTEFYGNPLDYQDVWGSEGQ